MLGYMDYIDESGAGSTRGQPARATTSTPAELDLYMKGKRKEIMDRLQPAIAVSEALKGFCNDPLSNVRLSVKEEYCPKLFVKQYKIPAALMPFAAKIF